MKEIDLIIISNDSNDWQGVYVNDELFAQGYSISEKDWIELIQKYKYFSGKIKVFKLTEEQMKELGYLFPINLSNIPQSFLK